jgi:hypothetical protein
MTRTCWRYPFQLNLAKKPFYTLTLHIYFFFISILSPIETISVWFITSPEEDSDATAKFLIKVI